MKTTFFKITKEIFCFCILMWFRICVFVIAYVKLKIFLLLQRYKYVCGCGGADQNLSLIGFCTVPESTAQLLQSALIDHIKDQTWCIPVEHQAPPHQCTHV